MSALKVVNHPRDSRENRSTGFKGQKSSTRKSTRMQEQDLEMTIENQLSEMQEDFDDFVSMFNDAML